MSRSKDYDYWVKHFASNLDSVEVADNAEQADVVICRLVTNPLLMSDNLVDKCSTCARMVQFRPHAPKEPRKLCDECGAKEIVKQDGDVSYMVTQNTMNDIARFVRMKKGN